MAKGTAIFIAAVSLVISGVHLSWTLMRKGGQEITQPTLIAIAFEKPDFLLL